MHRAEQGGRGQTDREKLLTQTTTSSFLAPARVSINRKSHRLAKPRPQNLIPVDSRAGGVRSGPMAEQFQEILSIDPPTWNSCEDVPILCFSVARPSGIRATSAFVLSEAFTRGCTVLSPLPKHLSRACSPRKLLDAPSHGIGPVEEACALLTDVQEAPCTFPVKPPQRRSNSVTFRTSAGPKSAMRLADQPGSGTDFGSDISAFPASLISQPGRSTYLSLTLRR